MERHAVVMREIVASSTPEQKAAARLFSKQFAARGLSINTPSHRAFFAVSWLRAYGEDIKFWETSPREALEQRLIARRRRIETGVEA